MGGGVSGPQSNRIHLTARNDRLDEIMDEGLMFDYVPGNHQPRNDASSYGERVVARIMDQQYQLAVSSHSPEVRASALGILMRMSGMWLQNRLSR